MIVGVGIDVVDVDRFEQSLARSPALRQRLFTQSERRHSVASLAARFAAKEALAKALGAPGGLHWADAEVRTQPSGRPVLELHGSVAERASRLGVRSVHVSMSHDAGIASALVVAEG
jgi:holo-[acyl-carrier protein] synthase